MKQEIYYGKSCMKFRLMLLASIQTTSVKQGINGEILVVGTTGSYNFFLKLDKNGSILSGKLFIGSDVAETFIDVFVDNNDLLIFGFKNWGICSDLDSRTLFIMRLKYSDVSVRQIKHYCFTPPSFSVGYVTSPYNFQVKKIADKFIVFGDLLESSNRNFMVARFDSNINFTDARIIGKTFATGFRHINVSTNGAITFIGSRANSSGFYYNAIDKNWNIKRERKL